MKTAIDPVGIVGKPTPSGAGSSGREPCWQTLWRLRYFRSPETLFRSSLDC